MLLTALQSINVIECPEFHYLLCLLHKDLRETDIPHRTKLCELILEVWKFYFQVVKQDLAVSTRSHHASLY